MKIYSFLLALVMSMMTVGLRAQNHSIWRQSRNAAGLGLDTTRQWGTAYFDISHLEGDFHRVQEGGTTNALKFKTERYMKIGKWFYGYGTFSFDDGRTKNRAYCDVLRPYNSDPYIFGSAEFGKYDFMDFDIDARLSTVRLGAFTYGVSVKYKNGDLSRLKDPRSRVNLCVYGISPSMTYTFLGKNTIGIGFEYVRRKEKLLSYSLVQTDAIFDFYDMSGLENNSYSLGGHKGFQRQFVNHSLGGEVSYSYGGNSYSNLLTFAYLNEKEYITEQYRRQPGRFYGERYEVGFQNRYRHGRLLHTLDFSLKIYSAYANEYLQKLSTTINPETGVESKEYSTAIVYEKRYTVDLSDLDASYKIAILQGDSLQRAHFAVKFSKNTSENNHYVPESALEYGGINIGGELGGNVLGGKLWSTIAVMHHTANNARLVLRNLSSPIAVNVLIPDMAWYSADYNKFSAQIGFKMPVTVKGFSSDWFVKFYGDYLKSSDKRSLTFVGTSFGIIF